jgi:hypothetical protein
MQGVLLKYKLQSTANQWAATWPPCILFFRPSHTIKKLFYRLHVITASAGTVEEILWNVPNVYSNIFFSFLCMNGLPFKSVIYLWRTFECDVNHIPRDWFAFVHPVFRDCEIGLLESNVTTFVFMFMLEMCVWLASQTGVSRDDVTWFVNDVKRAQTEESRDRLWIHWRDKKERYPTSSMNTGSIGNPLVTYERRIISHMNISWKCELIVNSSITYLGNTHAHTHTHTHTRARGLILHWMRVVVCFCGKLELGV